MPISSNSSDSVIGYHSQISREEAMDEYYEMAIEEEENGDTE